MFIVAENGSAIYNADTADRFNIYKFEKNGEEAWAVCLDYLVNVGSFYPITERTNDFDVAMATLKRIADALKNNVKLLDLAAHSPDPTAMKNKAKLVDLATYSRNRAVK